MFVQPHRNSQPGRGREFLGMPHQRTPTCVGGRPPFVDSPNLGPFRFSIPPSAQCPALLCVMQCAAGRRCGSARPSPDTSQSQGRVDMLGQVPITFSTGGQTPADLLCAENIFDSTFAAGGVESLNRKRASFNGLNRNAPVTDGALDWESPWPGLSMLISLKAGRWNSPS